MQQVLEAPETTISILFIHSQTHRKIELLCAIVNQSLNVDSELQFVKPFMSFRLRCLVQRLEYRFEYMF